MLNRIKRGDKNTPFFSYNVKNNIGIIFVCLPVNTPLMNQENLKEVGMKSIYLFISSYKSGKISAILIASLTLTLQLQMQLLFLSALLLTDFLTGINKSLKKANASKSPLRYSFWQTITSSRMRDSITKVTQYMLVVITSLLIQVLFFQGGRFEILDAKFSIPKLVVLFLSTIEIYSIFENLTGNKENILQKLEDAWIKWWHLIVKGEKK